MCLTVNKKRRFKQAEADIRVYKVLRLVLDHDTYRNKWFSPVIGKDYGYLQTGDEITPDELCLDIKPLCLSGDDCTIHAGAIHCCKEYSAAFYIRLGVAFNDKPSNRLKIIEMTIPKGAWYITGNNGTDMAASRLRFEKICQDF